MATVAINYNNWVFTTVRDWDEISYGDWTLKVTDGERRRCGHVRLVAAELLRNNIDCAGFRRCARVLTAP